MGNKRKNKIKHSVSHSWESRRIKTLLITLGEEATCISYANDFCLSFLNRYETDSGIFKNDDDEN